MICQMCGNADLRVIFHRGATYWGDSLHCANGASSSSWHSTRSNKHLHYICTTCRYDWTADTAEQSLGNG